MVKKNEKLPKEAWAFWANMNGPWWDKPQKVKKIDDSDDALWHKNGDAEIRKMGFDDSQSPYITFAAEDKKEVENFIAGFQAARQLVRNFAGG